MTEHRFRDHSTERLSDYVDGSLGAEDRRGLETHLASCETCRAMVEDLRHIKGQAGTLPPLTPPVDLWRRIAASIRAQQAASRTRAASKVHSFFPAWASYGALAASVVLVIASILILGLWNPFSTAPPAAEQEQQLDWVVAELQEAEKHYENAISGLEQMVAQDEDLLEPEVVAVLDENLNVIEQAIGESRAAAREQPDSEIARESLLGALRSKLTLLQNTLLMINEVRKGRGQNAYDIINKMRENQDPRNPI